MDAWRRKWGIRHATRIGLACGLFFLFAGTQAEAATTIGSDLTAPNGATFNCGSCTLTQQVLPGRQLTAPAGGVIVRWRIKTGYVGGDSLVLQVLSAPGATRNALVSSDPETPAVVGINTFPTRLPIAAGQAVGLFCGCTTQTWAFFNGSSPGPSVDYWNPQLTTGDGRSSDGSLGWELLVNADIEADGDGDGYGDETQDGCPTDATTHGPCPDLTAPETTITKQPRDKSDRTKVTYKFESDEPGSSFECKIDKKPFAPCTSPKKFKVRDGKHNFLVRAIDATGNVDLTADKDKFKIVD